MLNLSNREKNILISGILFVVVFFGFEFGIAPVFEQKNNLARILKDKQTAFEDIVELQHKFFTLSSKLDIQSNTFGQRQIDFSLFSFLDSLVQQSGIKENVVYMQPVTKKLDQSKYMLSIVKVKLKAVYLKEFIDFLYRIESSENGVTITSLSMSGSGKKFSSGKSRHKIDAVIETQILKLNGQV